MSSITKGHSKTLDHFAEKKILGDDAAPRILKQIADHLEKIHESGQVHGWLNPASILLNSDGTTVLSIQHTTKESSALSAEWNCINPDGKPSRTEKGDVFVLGCLFYYIMTGGQHPFGRSNHRQTFVKFNLYYLGDLSESDHMNLRSLIQKMIHHHPDKRPAVYSLQKHPFFWSDEMIVAYLVHLARSSNLSSDKIAEWDSTYLFPNSSEEEGEEDRNISTVSDILKQIMDERESSKKVLRYHKIYPDLLQTVFQKDCLPDEEEILVAESFTSSIGTEETDRSCVIMPIKDGIRSDTIETAFLRKKVAGSSKNQHQAEQSMDPESLSNMLVAAGSFGHVDDETNMKRRHGRLGGQYVHIFNAEDAASRKMVDKLKRLRYLNHQHILQIFFIVEQPSLWVAVEPFQMTLQTWLVDHLDDEANIKEVMTQITKGLCFLHSKDFIHGSLASNDIVIIEDREAVAKIAKIPTIDSNKGTDESKTDDVRRLGHIFTELLEKVGNPLSQHLILCMKDSSDELVPPCETISYHPFFWKADETVEFLQATECNRDDDFEQTKNEIHSILELPAKNSENLVKKHGYLLMKVLQLWLQHQNEKDDENDDGRLCHFYHPDYIYPDYGQEKAAKENLKILAPQNLNKETKILTPEIFTKIEKRNRGLHTQLNAINYLKSYIQDLKKAKSASLFDSLRDQPLDSDGRTALHMASSSDQFVESASTLLTDFNFNPNSKDGSGNVPLHYAVITRSERIIKLLLKNCALVSVYNNEMLTPLFLAIFCNLVVIAKLMLQLGKDSDQKVDPFNRNALHVSVYMNSYELVDFILKEKRIRDINETDDDGNTALHIAVFKNSKKLVHLLLLHRANPNVRNSKTLCPLSLAVYLGQVEIVDLLLKNGSDPNIPDRNGQVALHHAIRYQLDDSGITERLLNCAEIDVNARDTFGVTPLHWAAVHNRKQTVERLLIGEKVNVNTEDVRFGTPLEYAAAVNAVEIVKLLVSAGAQVNRKGWNQRTPLHIAAGYGSHQVVEFLIANKAMKIARDALGLTPMHYASYHNFQDLTSTLQPRGPLPKSKKLSLDQFAQVPHLISFISFKLDVFHISQQTVTFSIQHNIVNAAGTPDVDNSPGTSENLRKEKIKKTNKKRRKKAPKKPKSGTDELLKPEIPKPYQQIVLNLSNVVQTAYKLRTRCHSV